MNTEYQNNVWKWGWIVLVVLAIFLGVKTLDAFKELGDADPSYNSITVMGEGEIDSVPDVATFSFAVMAEASTVNAAQTQVTTKMDAILVALKEAGIEDRDIKTSDYSIYPRYRYVQSACTPDSCPPGRQVLDGYTASHNVTVKIRNTEKAGDILTLVGDRGATNISGLSFTTDDPDQLLADARAEAIKDARDKAKRLAKDLDVRLVRVVSYSDSTFNPPYPIPYGMGGGVAMETQAMDLAKANIPTGENKTRVSVTVVYEIR